MKLYTFGQPRVGDQPHAEIIEEYIGERYRILNNADPAGGWLAWMGGWAGARALASWPLRPARACSSPPPRRPVAELPLLSCDAELDPPAPCTLQAPCRPPR